MVRRLGDQCPELRTKKGHYVIWFLVRREIVSGFCFEARPFGPPVGCRAALSDDLEVRKLILHSMHGPDAQALDWSSVTVQTIKASRRVCGTYVG